MSSDENPQSNPSQPVDLAAQERAANVENAKAQAARIAERKDRVSNVIDDVWAETPVGQQEQQQASDETGTVDLPSDAGKQVNEPQEAERTQKDVVDEMWDEEFNQEAEEEVSEEVEVQEEEEAQSEELEGVEEADEVDLENSIVLTKDLEDGSSEEYAIPKDAKIRVKVDGVEQEVSIQDFANGISGQKAIAQKFSALNSEKQSFEQKTAAWTQSQQQARELLDSGQTVEAVQAVAESMGYDPQALFTGLFEQITPILDQYAGLDEAARQQWVQELRHKRAEYQARSAQEELKRVQTYQEQQAKVQKVQETYSMDDATFMQMFHDLEAEMESGSLSKQPISPELVGEYYQLRTYEGYIESALQGTELAGDKEAVNQILPVVNQVGRMGGEVSEASVKALVSEALSKQGKVDKAAKVNASLKKKGVVPKVKGGKKPAKSITRGQAGDRPQHWMERAVTDLEGGASATDLGLMSTKQQRNKR